ncbi:MAG: hypothetical protein QOD83_739 [Solirubrobacteraceae bacterium]|jgi:hypothetical protein|nr:hypothetical protein [Solirubrobacteraceae bacterium]MEA2182592.1 hypothetical protein [Solirubrobacteraceae bacterium]MEA2185142.1 hypothetical protein [Solirubrobacteraceae bacterium]MEA2230923.1 hypothetical protein [Solirubrobacteraceae bacterium]
MSEAARFDIEQMLRLALTPVEPPEDLRTRVESTLQELTDAAVDELDGWELGAMRDPRNWVRPVVATAVGATAGTALVVLRVRQQRKKNAAAAHSPLDLAQRTLRAAVGEARKLARLD